MAAKSKATGKKKKASKRRKNSSEQGKPEQWITRRSDTLDLDWAPYDDDQLKSIKQRLSVGSKSSDAELDLLLEEITNAAHISRGRFKEEAGRPTPSEIKKQIKTLYKAMIAFNDALGYLSLPAQDWLDNITTEAVGRPVTVNLKEARRKLMAVEDAVGVAADWEIQKGQQAKQVRREFVRFLVEIWRKAHGGRQPTRRVKRPDQKKQDIPQAKPYGPFNDLVKVCLAPLKMRLAGIDDEIKDAISMGKNHREKAF